MTDEERIIGAMVAAALKRGHIVSFYPDRLHDQIEGDLSLPAFAPVARPGVSGAGDVRSQGPRGGGGSGGEIPTVDPSGIGDEVRAAQSGGKARINQSRGNLETVTRGAKGASEEAADEVKEW